MLSSSKRALGKLSRGAENMNNPYDPVDQTGVVFNGLDIGSVVSEIQDKGYCVVENFMTTDEVERLRANFNESVPITEMRAIGTETGRTWRAHNLLGKTRAADNVFLDSRLRAIVDGVIGKYNQVNVTTLFNTLPGETKQFLHQDDGLWPIPRPHPAFFVQCALRFRRLYRANGATHLVPYSHRWTKPVDQSVDSIQVEMSSGSVVFGRGM